ncbi:DUF3078 domain-containing protein [Phaeodactylibacter sp.]|jgi:hypothetical protein|uniref:DUF3078 domain-containing protein n=1 Tax=Phaeodactylibacter sp. TaxID=1940289 RepID=UPI0025FBCBB6|nr:DUF3078 domain-containing protein [Phaeodactylibacter sp.]MCI4650535.1 DUF3078 domain-containing protein [Phaeodactylibacter sp.]MCI5089358.1 DUF3078 domain-containing protein [Phaeodactylibacter sp.]
MKRLFTILIACSFFLYNGLHAQTTAELEAEKAAKSATLDSLKKEFKALEKQVNKLQSDVASLTDQLTPYPRWKKGLLGNVGLNIANFDSWLPKDQPSTSAINIGVTSTAFINGDWENAFWRNSANLTLGWLKFDNKDNPDDIDEFQVSADALNVVSLYGYKLSPKFAISTLGEYRTSVLDGKFNNPGYLDLGVGATWTPVTDLVVVVHPLNYNFVFADEEFNFESSLGAKVVADYTKTIVQGLNWKSNLSAFLSYENQDFSNYTWVNTFSTAYKGIGIGLDVGLRNNKQEALAAGLEDNPLQTYWVLGLSYAISSN